MNHQRILTTLLLLVFLSSCAPSATSTPSEMPVSISTLTLTPVPTATATITPTITPEPTPMGGGTLKVAFYGSDQSGNGFLIVGDYFSGKIDYKIPVRNIFTDDVSWSPNGAYVLFVDRAGKITDDIDLKVHLLNVKTGQVTHLSTFPAGHGKQVNSLEKISWSADNKYILYSPWTDNNRFDQNYIASMDGIVQTTDGYYDDWLSDTKILIDAKNGNTFATENNQRDPFLASGLRKFDFVELTQDFILLNPYEKDKVEAILYPKDFGDTTAWQYDALMSNKITLVSFSPEIKNPQIHKLMSITELPNNQLSISGIGSFAAGEKTYFVFRVVVDKSNFPVVVEEKNLYLDEFPAIYSPDGQLVLLGKTVNDEIRWHLQLTLKDTHGQELRVDHKLSQFKGLTEVNAKIDDISSSSSYQFFSGVAFYWQP